jgi:hypothetical protein
MLAHSGNDALTFFDLVLPEKGHFVAQVRNPRTKMWRNPVFAASTEELHETTQELDGDGWEVYYAIASYKEANVNPPGTPPGERRLGRTKHNVASCRIFHRDLDAGSNKPYGSQQEILDAIKKFIKAVERDTGIKLPPPILVNSGNGIQTLWPVDQDLDLATWQSYMDGLNGLCERHGLHYDPARKDITSVLRPPGTHNRKDGNEKPVTCEIPEELIERGAGYPLEQFAFLIEMGKAAEAAKPRRWRGKGKGETKLDPRFFNRPDHLKNIPEDGNSLVAKALTDDPEYPPASAAIDRRTVRAD